MSSKSYATRLKLGNAGERTEKSSSGDDSEEMHRELSMQSAKQPRALLN